MRVKLPFSLPVVLSVSMHAALIIAVTWGWETNPHEPRVYRPQNVVQATLVELEARPAPAEEESGPQVVDLTAQRQAQERAEAERRRQQEAERQRQQREREQAQADRERRERQERERRQREERERQAREQEQQRQRQLDEALQRDQERRQAQEHAQITVSYTDLIAARIEQNWNRPPSARLGMQVTLMIHMVPTGEVVNVQVVQSSGNSAFDRSAEQAVRRVDRFTEVRDMPSEVFERNFRQLRLVFRPEDLRQ